jgi:hypothetical protein
MKGYTKNQKLFWYKTMKLAKYTVSEGMPYVFTAIAISFIWCLILTFLIILK